MQLLPHTNKAAMEISNRQCYAVTVFLLVLSLMVACTEKSELPKPHVEGQTDSLGTLSVPVPVGTPVIVVPTGPGKETAGTTSAVKSDLSKAEQSSAMPMPGQVNDHSTPLPKPSVGTASAPR